MTKTKEVLFQLPGKDAEQAVRLSGIVQGMSNALTHWENRNAPWAKIARPLMALALCADQMNTSANGKRGCNDPDAFRVIFIPLCERIHAALYDSIERDPSIYRKIMAGGRETLGARLTAVGLASLPTIEHTPPADPITFIWPDSSEDGTRVS